MEFYWQLPLLSFIGHKDTKMGILFWYILRQYLKLFSLCLTGLTSLYLVIDFFEKLRKFLRYDAELASMLMYFFFKIPDISFKLAPFSALIATLVTIGLLNKNGEITAMRSSGFSLIQITTPFLTVGALVSILLFSFTAVIIPLANTKAEYIKTVEIQKKPQPLSFTAKNLWLRIRNNTIMNIREIMPDGSFLKSIKLYQLNSKFRISQIVTADVAFYSEKEWTLDTATRQTFLPNGQVTTTTYPHLALEFSLTPEDFKAWISQEPERLTLKQLWIHINHLQNEGHNSARFKTDYWGRVALSFLTIIMTILGVSISLLSIGTRSSNVAKGIGLGLAISFLFWATHSGAIALGRGGALSPILAGWIACAMFLVVSLNLFLKVRY